MLKEEEVRDRSQLKTVPWAAISIAIALSLLFIVGTVLGTLHFAGLLPADKTSGHAATGAGAEYEFTKEHSQAIYLPLEPPFVVNFEGKGPARFLQISVEVMTRSPDLEEPIKKHMPAMRNSLVFLFGSQTYEDVAMREGKERLRAAALAAVQKIMESEIGEPAVEALYFTSFVMQ